MPTPCPALLKWPLVVAPSGDDTMYGKEGDGTGGGAGPGGFVVTGLRLELLAMHAVGMP